MRRCREEKSVGLVQNVGILLTQITVVPNSVRRVKTRYDLLCLIIAGYNVKS